MRDNSAKLEFLTDLSCEQPIKYENTKQYKVFIETNVL